MKPFKIQIAGLITQVQPLYETTAVYCHNYLSDRAPHYFTSVTEKDLAFEQYMLDVEAREEGMKLRKFTAPFLERAAIQRKIAEELLHRDTFFLHGSTVAVDDFAYLFTAACGTGKSTQTRLWRDVFGERAIMINDDKPFLQIKPNAVIAHGSPWSGKHGLDTNIDVPLKGICILKRGLENRIRPITAEEAAPILHHQSYVSSNPASQVRVHALAEMVMQRVPLWEMECTKDPQAAIAAYTVMSNI